MAERGAAPRKATNNIGLRILLLPQKLISGARLNRVLDKMDGALKSSRQNRPPSREMAKPRQRSRSRDRRDRDHGKDRRREDDCKDQHRGKDRRPEDRDRREDQHRGKDRRREVRIGHGLVKGEKVAERGGSSR